MKNSPCFGTVAGKIVDCPHRRPGCHADCADYIAYKAEIERVRPQRSDEDITGTYRREAARRKKRGRDV